MILTADSSTLAADGRALHPDKEGHGGDGRNGEAHVGCG